MEFLTSKSPPAPYPNDTEPSAKALETIPKAIELLSIVYEYDPIHIEYSLSEN